MKKIINGKMYNTETANCVGYWENGYGCGDFQYAEERLYRKRTGEFFIHGEGGAMTQYAESDGDAYCGGEKIIPISEDEAKEWAENHLTADDYESIFGEVEE
ncbi:MAG: hypothetical protein PUE58_07465 [Lachnospiraceae bacterium]|nr:hypothetical protein [Lachnospiraceae bacterium]